MVITNPLSPAIYRQKFEDRQREKANEHAIKVLSKSIKKLKKDAETHIKLELESNEMFEFLTNQIRTLRSALISISDVLMDEVEQTRDDYDKSKSDLAVKIQKLSKQVSMLQTEVNLHRSESDSYKAYTEGRFDDLKTSTDKNLKKFPRIEKEIEKIVKLVAEQQDIVLQLREEDYVKRSRFDHEMRKIQEQMDQLKLEFKNDLKALALDLHNICTDTNQYRSAQAKNLQMIRDHINDKVIHELKNVKEIISEKDVSLQEQLSGLNQSNKKLLDDFHEDLRLLEEKQNSKLIEMQLRMNQVSSENQQWEFKLNELQNETQKKYVSLSNALSVLMEMIGGNENAS